MRRNLLRWAGYALCGVALLLVLAAATLWIMSSRAIALRVEPRPSRLATPTPTQRADAPRHLRVMGCVSCHGRIDTMERVSQREKLSMGWCLECHRAPEKNLRPVEFVTKMDWQPDEDPLVLGARLREANHINPPQDCSTCHR